MEYLCIPLCSLLFYYHWWIVDVECDVPQEWFSSSFFQVHEVSGFVGLQFSSNLGNVDTVSSKYLFHPHISWSSALHTPLDVVPQVTGVLLGSSTCSFFPSIFHFALFLLLWFKVTGIFFSHVYTAVKPSSIFFTSDVAVFFINKFDHFLYFLNFSHWVYVFLYLLKHEKYINIHWSKALFSQLYHQSISID